MHRSLSNPEQFLSSPWTFPSANSLHFCDTSDHHLHQLPPPPSPPSDSLRFLLTPSVLQRSSSGIPDIQRHSQLNEGIRRVLSAGDVTATNYCAEEIAGGGKVGRYNAEERRERIEKYRSKRNQRNFQKKITYVCRKTLADSRPRIRGRFARNGDSMDTEGGELSSSQGRIEEEGFDLAFWANFLDNLPVTNIIS